LDTLKLVTTWPICDWCAGTSTALETKLKKSFPMTTGQVH